jgi:hypothetical protein
LPPAPDIGLTLPVATGEKCLFQLIINSYYALLFEVCLVYLAVLLK